MNGKPYDEYVKEVASKRANDIRERIHNGEFSVDDMGKVYGLGIDKRTGTILEAVNGTPGDIIPPSRLHPILDQRMRDAQGRYQEYGPNGQPIPGKFTRYPHFESQPTRHSEIKIANELLGRRGSEVTADTMSEFHMDTRLITRHPHNDGVPYCATCNVLLPNTLNNFGRNTHVPNNPANRHLPR